MTQSSSGPHIRARLGHPVVDSDGHTIEYLPVVREFMAEVGGPGLADRLLSIYSPMTLWRHAPPEMRKAFIRPAWWGLPARNTLDRATAMLPGLLYQRLGDLGIDFSVLYPTYGLHVLGVADEELRRAAARAFNTYHAELYREYADRLTTVALIPMHTPEEALAELDHAVGELGFKAVVMPGHVFRSMQAEARWFGRRMDCFGIDSEHDYDPVWQRCRELKLSPTFHSNGMGWGSHASTSNYMFNHLGSFAAANEAICRALLFGGVPMRFPELRFGFLEGGVGWACSLFLDLIEHFEKRNREALEHYNPRHLDHGLLRQLFETHAPPRIRSALGQLDEALRILSDPAEEPVDEFAGMGLTSVSELGDIFRTSLHFGCEPDDRMATHAFNERINQGGVRLRAIFSSDLGHWDIPHMQDVLHEAYELVEDGIMTELDFRDFVFANPVSLWAGTNRDFFKGTTIESEVRHLLAS
jgi:predicted TIM-barrel fold metal-dependent hydrolase